MREVLVAGVGMTPFVPPKVSPAYTEMGAAAVREALADAGIGYGEVQQAIASYVYGDSASGQRVLYDVGLSGVPIVNVNNNCASGSTALFLARQIVASGAADCVLAVGFEQMTPGALSENYTDRPQPLGNFVAQSNARWGETGAPMAVQLFGGAGRAYQERYGAGQAAFAKIAVKSRRHAERNDKAIFRNPLTVEEVLASPAMFDPLTRLMCCPPSCGAAAAVLVSADFARRHGIGGGAVRIAGQAMTTDGAETFAGDPMELIGWSMAKAAADRAYAEAGVGPRDMQVVELHDCFTANELVTYESLGLAERGGAERMIEDGDNSYGGRYVVNPSGGLMSKGHPLGATGLAQCYELVQQLRGNSGARQVEGARHALQHNLGLGGACVVTVYERAAA
ncbi:lipid-transfer protein [Sphingomonas canadensis]|uniref:propanoyl-CoA C-acyltransferase n=1 Tax=Sphingomonas canadensis TaxID=1219257 RepID=A0ABW3HB49_9SPHN|nr:lipid-transfer protein [Sphingomonas canadensis]MCW3836942.1 lipid-transfer protein [Sphingomonas canadensis]